MSGLRNGADKVQEKEETRTISESINEGQAQTRARVKNGVPHYMGLAGDPLLLMITGIATCGFLLFGYDQGVMSGIVSAPQFFRIFPDLNPANVGKNQASVMQAFYTAIYEVGCLAGAIFALLFGNKLGRRKNIMAGGFWVIIGTIIQITCIPGHLAGHQFVIGRIVTGFGNGLNTATIPSWQAECSKSHNRGLHICIEASMIATGTVIAYWVDFGLSYIDTSLSWRLPIGLQIIFAVILIFGTLYLPESPRYLLSTRQYVEGENVVAALSALPTDHEDTQLQKRVIVEALESIGQLEIKHVLTGGPSQHLRRTLVGASSQLFQQIGGCNAVIYFAPVIFEDYIGLERRLALILGGVNATVYALAAFFSYPMIERLGRRKMFLFGTAGQAGAMILSMACLIPYDVLDDKDSSATYGAVVGLFLFLIAFGCTWLELPWLYPAEISPNAIRTNANAISTMTNWSWNFAVVMWTPPMLAAWGGFGTFLFFGIVNLCFFPFITLFYVETKGRSLEEIDVIFARGFTNSEWYVHVANTMPKLSHAEVEREAAQYGLALDEEKHVGSVQSQ
ncbi:general substrate transporter [Schizophyllum commune H4-8]|uniref:Major facilitator superfamily (MFS) profile domain-containing protein n=1 Tax=Schizophyllum commune (strain H4-8 / FGSC 9210) TaxID=578458 RepID=D8PU01_SCHCM|nr:general substrate transporter [Schizophyllum commune H4-8]KAI5900770.1 general substrate transporter [Schizophyllum commune H4-8]